MTCAHADIACFVCMLVVIGKVFECVFFLSLHVHFRMRALFVHKLYDLDFYLCLMWTLGHMILINRCVSIYILPVPSDIT